MEEPWHAAAAHVEPEEKKMGAIGARVGGGGGGGGGQEGWVGGSRGTCPGASGGASSS
jgi:hypothetical protein